MNSTTHQVLNGEIELSENLESSKYILRNVTVQCFVEMFIPLAISNRF